MSLEEYFLPDEVIAEMKVAIKRFAKRDKRLADELSRPYKWSQNKLRRVNVLLR
jgi:hypothetical protein